jgi:hypothetical protein
MPGVGAWNSSKWEEMLENTTFPITNQKCAAHMQEKVFLLYHLNGINYSLYDAFPSLCTLT